MATNAEFPPYEYKEGNEIIGIDVEIAQAIAKKLGKTLVIEDMAFDSIIPAVQSGKADIGVAGMTVRPDRLENVDFSDTYVKASQVIIVRKDNTDIKSPDDLVGKTVGVQLGTTGDIYAENITDVKLERYNKGFEAVQALQQGKIDAVIIDDQPAAVFASQNDDIMVIDEPFTDEEYAIAVKKGNTELLDKINEVLKELKESGELQKIIDKYIMD
jgi:polar amino acid transport system substrate-binding protein